MRYFYLLLAIALIAGSTYRADAATFVVTKTADTSDGVCNADCSLREAVAAANASPGADDIRFASNFSSAAAEFVLTSGEIAVTNSGLLSIDGFGRDRTSISGDGRSRIFYAAQNASLTLTNLTLRRGNGAGAQFSGDGGAVTGYGANLTIRDCAFAENSGGLGGALFAAVFANVDIANSSFRGNTGRDGGAVYAIGTMLINGTDFTNNSATGGGGGLYAYSRVSVNNSSFDGNTAAAGGGVYSLFGLDILSTLLQNNVARNFDGGAVNVASGMLKLEDSRVISNRATVTGGGIRAAAGSVTRCIVRDNISSGSGGGISGPITVVGTLISGNSAVSGGGIWGGGTISNSSITRNTAVQIGGGMFGGGSVTNSTISGNRAGDSGGGIDTRAALSLKSVTVVDNQAASGAGLSVFGAAVTTQNSIFANNPTFISTQEDIYGPVQSLGSNLIESTLNTTINGVMTSDIVGVDPLLFPLTLGDTANYHIPQPNSPVIDRGSSAGLASDQRGRTRPVDILSVPNGAAGDAADIGAIERQLVESSGIEGDVAPAPNGDGAVLSNDITLIRQFVLRNLSPDPSTNEFQRIDTAPYATRGDGLLNAADVVQARRYALGLDPPVAADGPTVPARGVEDEENN